MNNFIFGDKRSGFAVMPIVIAGVLVVVLGAAGWTYRKTIQFILDPEERTIEAIDHLVETKAAHFRAVLAIDIPKTSQPVSLPLPTPPIYGGKITIELEGDADKLDPAQAKWQAALKLGLVSDGVSVSLAGEAKNIGDLLFFKLTEFPPLGPLGGGIEEYKGKWWKIDLAQLRELQAKQQALLEESIKNMPADEKRKAEELIKEFTAAAERALEVKFLTGFENIGREKINGVSTFHVKRFINKEGLVDAYFEILKLVPGWYAKIMFTANITGQLNQSGPPDFEMLKQELKKSLPDFPEVPVHFWIGVKDGKVHQIQPDLQNAIKDKKINVTLNLSKHDRPVDVMAPVDAEEWDLTPYLGGFGLSVSPPPPSIPIPSKYPEIPKRVLPQRR